jgi:hypothetical protein
MATPAPHASKHAQFGPYAAEVDEAYADTTSQLQPGDFEPGERIGRPLINARRKVLVRALVVSMLGAAGSWAWLNHQATLTDWGSATVAAIAPLLEQKTPAPTAQSPLSPPQQSAGMPQTWPASSSSPAVSPLTAASLAPTPADPDTDATASPLEKLPPPVIDPADPYQKRALAVGLHPDLSRVLLAKLSPADFRNAGVAIKTALSETADTEIYVWPRQRTAELALFQVKFVAGAPSDCRRYVVMVTKDGWLTTALPMEKCGVRMKEARK